MKPFSFYAVLLGLCIYCLGNERSYANNRVDLENSAPVSSAKPLISAVPANVEEFIVRGTEPFWSVSVSRSGIVYSAPETNNRRYPYTAPITASSRPNDLVRVYRLNGKPNGLLVLKKVSACSDGMSDRVYPYDATLILGNQVLEGCAEKK